MKHDNDILSDVEAAQIILPKIILQPVSTKLGILSFVLALDCTSGVLFLVPHTQMLASIRFLAARPATPV